MATGDYVLRNIFASKPLRDTILVSTSMLSGSMNQMTLNKSCLYDTFSRWPPYKYEKWRFPDSVHDFRLPHLVTVSSHVYFNFGSVTSSNEGIVDLDVSLSSSAPC